jgi:hypothetical protein
MVAPRETLIRQAYANLTRTLRQRPGTPLVLRPDDNPGPGTPSGLATIRTALGAKSLILKAERHNDHTFVDLYDPALDAEIATFSRVDEALAWLATRRATPRARGTPWERSLAWTVLRISAHGSRHRIEPGIVWFVRALEDLGAIPLWSCEGHPRGTYVTFAAPYDLAQRISEAGFFTVEISRRAWSMRLRDTDSFRDRNRRLQWASDQWIKVLGVDPAEQHSLPSGTDG